MDVNTRRGLSKMSGVKVLFVCSTTGQAMRPVRRYPRTAGESTVLRERDGNISRRRES